MKIDPVRAIVNGEEQPGGLVIVRAPAPTKSSLHIEPVPAESRAPSRQPSTQPQSQSQPQSQPSRPAAKKLRADGSVRAVGKAKDREVYAATRADPEVDEDVRQMQSETDTLRRKSQAAEQAAASLNGDVQFPPRTPRAPGSGPSSRRDVDTVAPLAQQETPQIEKNKIMRGETGHRRRSSVSRGKRATSSYESTGVICEWHAHLFCSLIRQPCIQLEYTSCSPSAYIRVRLKLLQTHRLRASRTSTRPTTPYLVFQSSHERTRRSSPTSVVVKTSIHELWQGPTTSLNSTDRAPEADGGDPDADVGREEG